MKFIKVSERLPEEKDGRVLAFSPIYPEGHFMRWRIIDGQFIRITSEVDKWISLNDLEKEN